MPKVKKNKYVLVKSWIDQISDKYLTYDGNSVYCNGCNKEITCDRKSQLTQHISTSTHKMNVLHLENNEHSENINESDGKKQQSKYANTFYVDLCKAMIAVKMPWRCLDNETWRNFLAKYTRQQIPNESTLRKNYLDVCYNSVIENIRSDIGDNYIWISVDETTDKLGRQVANFIVGKLCEETTTPHLISSQVLERTNNTTIARFVNSNMKILWPRESHEERVLLLVTDAAAYMLKAARDLQIFYPNIIHLTCLVHGFNRVAEEVRLHFPLVNTIISSVKKIFLKAPLRIEEYRAKLGNIPLPPEPILTRWGTWIEAALFYANNFTSIREVIESFNSEDAKSIISAKNVLQNPQLVKDLCYIKTYFKNLPKVMTKLESVGLPLIESTEIARSCIEDLKAIPGPCGQRISEKIQQILNRNPGVKEIFKISDI
ncbi:uncharacterized protein LOC120360022 [Solenopsis invicta]|uniref:uncharacterized protein LOC120360022 n=1 Tax=Solenopsis invicta TaxID=13686 RepID=UPI00193DDFA3|nr:uncharacterized protein LOC120360022 [Solenopsis invicta]